MHTTTGSVESFADPFGLRVREEIRNKYFVPLYNGEIPDVYRQTRIRWQNFAEKLHYDGPVAWLVKSGFRLAYNAPEIGPCYGNFRMFENCRFFDEPTREGLVFWVPQLVAGSINKYAESQKALLALYRSKFDLPSNHLCSFGSAALLSGLILSYYRWTGIQVPKGGFFTRTGTLTTGRARFAMGWFRDRLVCEMWRHDRERFPNLGIFATGLENLAP